MQDRNYYELLFVAYPDVVTVRELRIMLGGICEKTALSLLRQNTIQHFRIGSIYHIPKVSVIDYMVSPEYIVQNYNCGCQYICCISFSTVNMNI